MPGLNLIFVPQADDGVAMEHAIVSLSSHAVHVKLTARFSQESFLIAEKHEASRFSVSFCLVLFESSGFKTHSRCVAG